MVRFTFMIDTPSDRLSILGLESNKNLMSSWDAGQDLVPAVQMLDEDTCRWMLEQSVDAANFPQLFIRMTGAE